MRGRRWIFFLYCILSLQTYATEFAPWFGPAFLPELRLSAAYQNFAKIDSHHHALHYPGKDFFADLSLSIALDPVVLWPLSVEIESVGSRTHHHSLNFDCFKFTGRYQWFDDIVGDPFSLTSGISLIFPFEKGLTDISSFHHGCFEYEGHVAFGKEKACRENWIFRHYGLLALGSSDRGSPWLRGGYFLENKVCGPLFFQAFLEGLMGFGKRHLHKHHFQGYGAIQHRSIDGGIKLSYSLDYYGVIALEYRRRLFARNFPLRTNWLQLSLIYPFGI